MTMELEQSLKESKLNNTYFQLSAFRVILAILLTDAVGITSKYFGIDTYFIFLGFRFHLCAVLPFLILYNKNTFPVLIAALRKPYFKKKILPLFWIFFPLIILLLVLYFLKKIDTGDPDYFYEFGLSSIFDYPLYLIWNFPQLCLLFVTLISISGINKNHFLISILVFVFLFFWEIVPVDLKINPLTFIPFISMALIASFFVTILQNIYWFAITVFSSIWCIIILFGSSSSTLINLFFAREYDSWEGFLNTGKEFTAYIAPAYFLLLFLVILFYVILKGHKGDIKDKLFR